MHIDGQRKLFFLSEFMFAVQKANEVVVQSSPRSSHIESRKAFTYWRRYARLNGRDGFCVLIENVRRAVVPSIYAIPQIILSCCQRVVLWNKTKQRKQVKKYSLEIFSLLATMSGRIRWIVNWITLKGKVCFRFMLTAAQPGFVCNIDFESTFPTVIANEYEQAADRKVESSKFFVLLFPGKLVWRM